MESGGLSREINRDAHKWTHTLTKIKKKNYEQKCIVSTKTFTVLKTFPLLDYHYIVEVVIYVLNLEGFVLVLKIYKSS